VAAAGVVAAAGRRLTEVLLELATARESGRESTVTAIRLEVRAVQAEARVRELEQGLEEAEAVVTLTAERAALHKVLVETALKPAPGFLELAADGVRAGESWAKDHRTLAMVGALVVVADWATELTRFTARVMAVAKERDLGRARDYQKLEVELGGFQAAVCAAVESAQARREANARRDEALGGLKVVGGTN
jgi:hypothetical protein